METFPTRRVPTKQEKPSPKVTQCIHISRQKNKALKLPFVTKTLAWETFLKKNCITSLCFDNSDKN